MPDKLGLPWWLSSKELPCNAEDMAGAAGSTPGSERSPGEGNATHSSILTWKSPRTAHAAEKEPDMAWQLNNKQR